MPLAWALQRVDVACCCTRKANDGAANLLRALVTIAREFYRQLPEKTRDKNWQRIANGVGDTAFVEQIAQGERVEKLVQLTQKDVEAFKAERKEYLMYP